MSLKTGASRILANGNSLSASLHKSDPHLPRRGSVPRAAYTLASCFGKIQSSDKKGFDMGTVGRQGGLKESTAIFSQEASLAILEVDVFPIGDGFASEPS